MSLLQNNKFYRICGGSIPTITVYLFFGQYEIYNKVIETIINYEIDKNYKNKTFWNIILLILPFLTPNEKFYILIFDQYNAKIDPYNQINDVWNLKEKIGAYNITIKTLSTLNNKDTKDYKIKIL